ncbi:MAG: hypothetical protein ACFCU1_09585 [Sumerlaeia bacterium]
MKKSEKILAGITGVTVLIYALLTFTGGSESLAIGSAEIESLREDYQQRIEQIKLADTISQQYFDIVGQSSQVGEPIEGQPFRPDIDFLDEVQQWCADEGFKNPKFDSRTTEIRNVDDYLLVNVTVRIDDAMLGNLAQLLKKFEANGLILKEVDLSSRTDRREVDSEIVIGKIVQNYIN